MGLMVATADFTCHGRHLSWNQNMIKKEEAIEEKNGIRDFLLWHCEMTFARY
jgi:hypothetical protein